MADAAEKARRQMIAGAMTVLGACMFGGLAAIVLVLLDQRAAGLVAGGIAVVVILAGIVVQVGAVRKLKAVSGSK